MQLRRVAPRSRIQTPSVLVVLVTMLVAPVTSELSVPLKLVVQRLCQAVPEGDFLVRQLPFVMVEHFLEVLSTDDIHQRSKVCRTTLS